MTYTKNSIEDFQFNGWLESQKIQSQLDDTLRGADDGELYLQAWQSEFFQFSDGQLKKAKIESKQGFGLRVVCGDLVGFSHSNDLDESAFGRARDAVKLAKSGGAGSWDVSPDKTNSAYYTDENPYDSISVQEKIALLQTIDSYARGHDPRVKQVKVELTGKQSVVRILRPGAERFDDARPLVQLRVTVMMEQNGRMGPGMSAAGGRYEMKRLTSEKGWKGQVKEAARMAAVNLISKPAPAGKKTVVLESGWPGVMVHEAVGHGLEGDAVYKGQSIYSGQVGQRVAAKGVTIVDNGTISERRGSLAIDDEGTPTRENVLIEDGVLKGFMHDRLSARQMKTAPTGNGRRENYANYIMPRMTNTYMTSGTYEDGEILASVDDGIYVVNLGGGQVNATSGDFVFECTEAYRLRKGKIEEPIKGATLIGNGPEAMKNVMMVGKDSKLDSGMGVCGKNGQTVPVGVGQPMVSLADMTIGGTG